MHVAECEGEWQQLECPAQDLTRCQSDWLVGESAQVSSGVRETKAVTDDGAEARADAQQLTCAETVPDSDDDHYAEEADAQPSDDRGAKGLLAQDEECDDQRGQRGARVDETCQYRRNMGLAVGEEGEGSAIQERRENEQVSPRLPLPGQRCASDAGDHEKGCRTGGEPCEGNVHWRHRPQPEFDPPERASPDGTEQNEPHLPRDDPLSGPDRRQWFAR